jgi:glutaredoxin
VKKVVIYSKNKCPYCTYAEDACKQLCKLDTEFNHVVLKLDEDYTKLEFKTIFPSATTVPQIIVDGMQIGGWDEFKPRVLARIQGE